MILFLDFDGVLHPDDAYLEKGGPVLRAEGSLFMWAPFLADLLATHTHVKIVLSTSWVKHLGFSRTRRYLPLLLRERVIGATWHSDMAGPDGFFDWDQATRYQQITRYVLRAQLENWIALDDDDEGWSESAASHLILTDPARGVADPATVAALRYAISN